MSQILSFLQFARSLSPKSAFKPAASRAVIANLEAVAGGILPQDCIDLYSIANGELTLLDEIGTSWAGVFGEYYFISVEDSIKFHGRWLGTAKVFEEDGLDDEPVESYPPGHVREVVFDPGWIPFASSGNSFLAFDTHPGESGTVGQIINFGRDDDLHFVMGASLADFISSLTDFYRAGLVHRLVNPLGEGLYDTMRRNIGRR